MISRWWMALAFALVLGVSSVLSGVGGATGSDIAVDNALFLPMVSQAGLSITPSLAPTQAPTQQATPVPTDIPTESPTDVPTEAPTEAPTGAPTEAPTEAPTGEPTETPSTPVATTTSTPIPPTKTPTGDMILIAAGEFEMGCDEEREACTLPNEKPLHTVYLDAYEIDQYEVTNARYQACVADGVCTEPSSPQSHYDDPDYADYPVICVTWEQADAFCEWEDSRLPTEAEWERAARGGSGTCVFPWGDAPPTCAHVNAMVEVYDDWCVGTTVAVGSYPTGASPDELMDMSGNVVEWVNDWYDADYYQSMPVDEPADNPQGPTGGDGDAHVLRGGSWMSKRQQIRVAYRGNGTVHTELDQIGFRCARSDTAGE